MQSKDFNIIIETRLSECRRILIEKAKEYAKGDVDKLHNFNKASEITGECREKVLFGFALKHLVSVMDIINDMNNSKTYIPSRELTSEKIGDLINYLLLLEASIEDARNKDNPF